MEALEKYALALIILLTIAFRLPVTPHEIGSDSFVTHAWVNKISETGKLESVKLYRYTPDPIYFRRFYQKSNSLTLPLELLLLSWFTGLGVEYTILFFSIFLSVFAVITIYTMLREYTQNRYVIFFATFSFALSPLLILITLWTASTRALFLAILPLLFWSFLKFHNKKQKKYLWFSALFTVVLFLTHSMILLIPLVIVAFLGSILLGRKRYRFLPIGILLLSVLMFLSQFLLKSGVHRALKYVYRSGFFFQGFETHKIFLNMLIDYLSSGGFLLLFFPLGFLLLLKKLKNSKDIFLLLVITFAGGLTLLGKYTLILLLPVLSLLAGLGLFRFIEFLKEKRNLASPVLASLILLSTATTIFMLDHWLFAVRPRDVMQSWNTQWMQERTYNAGTFLNSLNGSIIVNDNLIVRRISSIVDPNRIMFNQGEKDIPIVNRTIPGRYPLWYPIQHPEVEDLFSENDIQFVVENTDIAEKYTGNYYLYNSTLLKSIHESNDKIYDNGLENIWLV